MNFSRYAYRSRQTQILSEADLYALVEQARRLNALEERVAALEAELGL